MRWLVLKSVGILLPVGAVFLYSALALVFFAVFPSQGEKDYEFWMMMSGLALFWGLSLFVVGFFFACCCHDLVFPPSS